MTGSDGVWETQNADGEMFCKDALRDEIKRDTHRSSETICEAYRDEVILVVVKCIPKGDIKGLAGS